MNALSSIIWLWPHAFLALPLPLLVYALAPGARRSRARALMLPDIDPYRAYTSESGSAMDRRWLRVLLLAVAWCALVTAAARPQSYADPVGVPFTGRDLMLGIDISGSMRETDLYAGNTQATRMAVVRQVAQDFVARREGDRIGLIMFGSQAYVQTPLTFDHKTVQHFLAEATVGLAGRSTAIGDAIGLGVKRLRERPESSRVLILLTDGANSAGVVDPLSAAEVASGSGIRIHTIGVGADPDFGGLNVPFGSQRSELDERTLRVISNVTGGQYFRARNQQELANIYDEIDRLEPTEKGQQEFRPLDELFAWPLGVALVISMLWAVMFHAGPMPGQLNSGLDSEAI